MLTIKITTNFKLLKVLDFEDAPNLEHLPKDIGSLFQLKYLSVRGTRVRSLPKSIGKLENLETLDLKQSLVYELPNEIKGLHKLQYLSAYHMDQNVDFHMNMQRGIKVEKGIGQLKALQKLCFIEASVVGVDILKELCTLTEMRRLGIIKLRSEDGKTLFDCIQMMNNLESLDVASVSEHEAIDLESMSSPPQLLKRLILQGRLRKLPEWITRLQNLVRIEINWSKLEDDPLEAFQNLQNLLELRIGYDAYIGETLYFKKSVFPKLKVLRLCYLRQLCMLLIEEGALCNLEALTIGPCPLLKELAPGFQHLRKLKEFIIREMPINFLILQNFQSLQSIGANIWFIHRIRGKLLNLRFEWVMKVLTNIQDYDREEWESEFENMLSDWV